MAGPKRKDRADEAREYLCGSLVEFAKYINPHYMYGDIHEEVFKWLEGDGPNQQQLLLLPRGHLKSHCIGVWCLWIITNKPWTSIVYLSSGEALALKQIDFIKKMVTSDRYRKLWPDMVHKDEGKRDKWTAWGFNVDHPKRKEMGTSDMTIVLKTIGSNFTGLHCDVQVYDDVQVPNNSYTETGRQTVKASVSQCASIKNPGAITKAVGTLYHPKDIYYDFANAMVKHWDEELGDFKAPEPLWEIMQRELEDNGDLTGDYLWPATYSPKTGAEYGFNIRVAATKKAEYESVGQIHQWYAQYYNNVNESSSEKVSRDSFQYYDPKFLTERDGSYYFKEKRLSLFAAMDVAWTTKKSSDYTALGVIGVDEDWNIFVLALDRFKTDDYDTYYEHVEALHRQWGFRKLHVETNSGGTLVANEIKKKLRQNGHTLIVEGKAATAAEGKKEERHAAVLTPRVKNGNIFFLKGGLTPVAIEEIVLERPPNDDLKDVLTAAIVNANAPAKEQDTGSSRKSKVIYHKRFGGRIRG